MTRFTVCVVLVLGFAFNACSGSTPSSPTTAAPTINTFTGSWRSTTTTAVAGACSSTNWSVNPTGANTATIAYSATCAGIPVNGTGNGTLNGSTFSWTTNGTAANACPFGLSGTAVQDTTTPADLRVDYSGTVCGVPVAGTQLM